MNGQREVMKKQEKIEKTSPIITTQARKTIEYRCSVFLSLSRASDEERMLGRGRQYAKA